MLAAKLAMIELAGGMGYRQPNYWAVHESLEPPDLGWRLLQRFRGSRCRRARTLAIGSETWGSILSRRTTAVSPGCGRPMAG